VVGILRASNGFYILLARTLIHAWFVIEIYNLVLLKENIAAFSRPFPKKGVVYRVVLGKRRPNTSVRLSLLKSLLKSVNSSVNLRRGPVLGGPLWDIWVLDLRSVDLYQEVN
jgi:hypothetical protein